MPDHTIARIVEIEKLLNTHIKDQGAAPCPTLNSLFTELTSLVVAPDIIPQQDKILSALQVNHNDTLISLRRLCALGEIALEKSALDYIISSPVLNQPAPENCIDKMHHFQDGLSPVYPYQWGETQARLQKMLLAGPNTPQQNQTVLFYGFTGLALSQLFWIWNSELNEQNLKILAVDPDPIQAEAGKRFVSALVNNGFITADAIEIKLASSTDLQKEIADRNIKIACLTGMKSGSEKGFVFKYLQETSLNTLCMTYPDGLVRLLYQPFDIEDGLHPQWQPQSCLLPNHADRPALPVSQTLQPEKTESLWLSSYIFRKRA